MRARRNPGPTDLNLETMERELARAGGAIREVHRGRVAALKKCIAAGFLAQRPDGAWVATPAGEQALADLHERKALIQRRWRGNPSGAPDPHELLVTYQMGMRDGEAIAPEPHQRTLEAYLRDAESVIRHRLPEQSGMHMVVKASAPSPHRGVLFRSYMRGVREGIAIVGRKHYPRGALARVKAWISARPNPAILDRCVQKVRGRGMPERRAWAICTRGLQRAGVLAPGTRTLTAKGVERNALSVAKDFAQASTPAQILARARRAKGHRVSLGTYRDADYYAIALRPGEALGSERHPGKWQLTRVLRGSVTILYPRRSGEPRRVRLRTGQRREIEQGRTHDIVAGPSGAKLLHVYVEGR